MQREDVCETVYVKLVGTFGLSCASYWWTRVAACGLRLTYHLLGPDFPLDSTSSATRTTWRLWGGALGASAKLPLGDIEGISARTT